MRRLALHSFFVTISPKTQSISFHNHHIRLFWHRGNSGYSIEILQIEETNSLKPVRSGERERVICRDRLSLSNAVRVDKKRKNLPSSFSFALSEFADWRCHLQSGPWLVSSICNISMGYSQNSKDHSEDTVLTRLKRYKPNWRRLWRQFRKSYLTSVSTIGKNVGISSLYRKGITLKEKKLIWMNK